MKLSEAEDKMKNKLYQIVGILVISLTMVSCKMKDQGRGAILTQRAMRDLATGIRLNLRDDEEAMAFAKMTPKELFEYMDSVDLIYYDSWLGQKEVRDNWETPFRISIRAKDFTIESPGKDKEFGTDDDITERFLISP